MSAFVDSLLDLLEPLGGIMERKMFGGYGIYKDGAMFGLVAGDRFYIRTDDASRDAFVSRGCEPFVFGERNGKAVVSRYFEPPESAFINPQKMRPWAVLGIEATMRAPARKAQKAKHKPQDERKSTKRKKAR